MSKFITTILGGIVLGGYLISGATASPTPIPKDEIKLYKKEAKILVQSLFNNYSSGRFMEFLALISPNYTGSNSFDKGNLANSVSSDTSNLRLYLKVVSINQLQVIDRNGAKIVRAQVGWNRRADFMSVGFNRWKTNGKVEMSFEITPNGPIKLQLVGMRGDFPFGLTNRKEQIIIDSGTLNGDEVTTPIIMENGEPDFSSSTVSGTSFILTTATNSFDFSKNRRFTSPSEGDIYGNAGIFYTNSPAGIQAIAGATSLDSVTSVPTSGYGSNVSVMVGEIVAVKTKEGNFAKVQYTSTAGTKQNIAYTYQQQTGRAEF